MSKATLRAAFFLLPYAGVLIGLDVAAHYGSLTNAELPVQFYLASDRSFGEYLEYALTAAIAVMMFLLWRRERAIVYLAHAILFVWLTLDNWIELHETFGLAAGPLFPQISALPVEPSHLAEASLMVGVGVFWLASLALAVRSITGRALAFNLALAACVFGAALFGVVVDLLVVWGEQGKVLHAILTFTEDAGEFAMIILAFLLTVGFFDLEYRQKHIGDRETAADSILTSG
ncbi:hypothetical protein [Erythrobacter crassostreae]|uniref:Uncharacterized protein n=1 Tax=Erythrobacter crassostreae TaxID=2828328 RepID=A0A9X1F2J7_9SPHN|nr:hypothetical protein [Erythrobacter crassostrea]MBV7258168.1 hypothetical protein [Erythrobacter crassostrea]